MRASISVRHTIRVILSRSRHVLINTTTSTTAATP